MKRLKRYLPDVIIIMGFGLLPLLLFWDVSAGGQTMLPVDNLFQMAPWSGHAVELGIGQPQNPLIGDLMVQNFVWKQFIREGVAHPQDLLWNPHLFAGVPFLAAGQHSAYYPFSLIFLILPLAQAYGWFVVSQLWLAGALMYVYGRILKMRRSSALLAGLVFQGGGYIVVSAAVFPMIIGAVVWLPFLLGMIEKVIQGGLARGRATILWAALGAAALGAQVLAGHIEYTIYTLLVMGLYALWRLVAAARHRGDKTAVLQTGAWLAAMVTLGLMFSAVQLIPLYELGQVNFREGGATLAEVRSFAFPVRRALTFVIPNFFGNPAHQAVTDVFTGETILITQGFTGQPRSTTEWGVKNYVEGGVYLGILPLLLAVLGVIGGLKSKRNGRRSLAWFYLFLSFFSLAFIFGTPLYAILYYGLPFVNQLHTPFRWVFPLSLAVAVLAGFGADYVSEIRDWRLEIGSSRRSPISNLQSPTFLLAILLFVGGILLLAGLWGTRLMYGRIQPFVERVFLGMALAADAFPDAQTFFSYEWRQAAVFGLMLLGAGLVLLVSQMRWGGKRPYWTLLAAALIVADIFIANAGFHASNDPALVEFQPEMAAWLEAQPGEWRLTSFVPKGAAPFAPNAAWMFGLQDVRGYDSIIPKQYTDYMAAIEPQYALKFNQVQPIANWESLNSPLLDVLGVKYVITAVDVSIDLPKYELVWEGEGVRIYENLGAAPRAYVLPQRQTAVVDDPLTAMTSEYDPRQFVVVETGDWRLAIESRLRQISNLQSPISPYQPAQITNYGNIEVLVDTAVTAPSWLILNDSYFPGWKAYVRPLGAGEDAEQQIAITRVNGNFRGILLEPGEWTVRFRYSPLTFQLGGLISFMGVIILLFALVVWAWQTFLRAGGQLSVTQSIAKNSMAPIGLNLFNKFIDFAFAMFYLRVLGPAGAGSFQTAIVTAGLFEIVANFGLDILLIRDVSQDRSKASYYLYNTSILRLGLALFAALPIIALIAVTQFSDQANALTPAEILATGLIMIGMVISGLSKGVTGLFYVYEEAEVPNTVTTVTTILKVAFGVAVLLAGLSFVGLAGVSILTNLVTFSILGVMAWRRYDLHGPYRLDQPLQRQILKAGFPLMLIHLLQTVFISIDTYLLRVMLPDGQEVAGWYSSAYKWFNALQIIPSFFTLALFPIISRKIKESLPEARRMYGLSVKLMYLLALPIAAVTFYLAYPLVRLLGGPEFLPHGAIALQIVIWSIPIGWMNSVTNYVLISLGMERMQPRAFAIAVAFNIITNMIFIPMYTYKAAGVTTILSEIVLLLVFSYYLRQKAFGTRWLRFMWKPGLVTAVMLALMWAGGQVSILLGLALGLVVYPAGLLLLHVIGPEERAVLANILPTAVAARLHLT
ncbi:MAG: oligosaccharide flippase family protein [Chloroflexi bacterium]|nr:oligosaccharide flippase family protein [Chloroflexota bacterium]